MHHVWLTKQSGSDRGGNQGFYPPLIISMCCGCVTGIRQAIRETQSRGSTAAVRHISTKESKLNYLTNTLPLIMVIQITGFYSL